MSAWLPALAALTATVAALLVLWPLRRSDRRAPFIAMVLAVGVAGACLYLLVGQPQAPSAAVAAAPTDLGQGVQALEQALQRDPQRADGWALLGRARTELGQHQPAADAFARAVALAPDDPGVLVEAAQARAQADAGKQFDDTALQWLRHARQLAPDAERASWLLGIALRQRGQDAEAAGIWEALLPRLDPGAASALREQIAIARGKAGLPAATAAAAAVAGTALGVQVRLDPAFAARASLPADASVFVIARVPGGPPMPVAVEKHPLGALPLQLSLDDADSPMPTQPLSAHAEVEVFARLSVSGNASRQDGDLDSAPVRVRLPHAGTVQLVLGAPDRP